jgi:hypothetical protein
MQNHKKFCVNRKPEQVLAVNGVPCRNYHFINYIDESAEDALPPAPVYVTGSLIPLYSEQTLVCQNLRSYIIAKEKHDLSKLLKAEPTMSRVLMSIDPSEMDQNEASSIESEVGMQDQRRMTITDRVNEESHEMLWKRIEKCLTEQIIYESIAEYLIVYTNVLKLHIDNRVTLDKLCIKALVCSVRPSYIEEIFNLNLIDADTDINSLMRNGKIFHDDYAIENLTLNLLF